VRFEIETPADFSFAETLNAHGWRRLAPFECDDSKLVLHRAEMLTNSRVVLVTMQAERESILVVVDEDADEGELTERVRVMFQLGLQIGRFHDYCSTTGDLAHIPVRKQGRLLCSPTLWEDCCKVILTTNTTWNQTVSMTKRLVDTYGSASADQPSRKAFPPPTALAAVEFEEFEATARFGYRNRSIHSLAVAISNGDLDLEKYRNPEIDSKVLWKRLIQLRGIGPYAASCLMIYLGRYDRVNVDSWARMMVSKEVGRPVSDKDVHEFFAPHGEWSGLVYHFYPWKMESPAY
jgi:3-methyladenine DNA glycosylase/8-oxoguanine DNA glycosylase